MEVLGESAGVYLLLSAFVAFGLYHLVHAGMLTMVPAVPPELISLQHRVWEATAAGEQGDSDIVALDMATGRAELRRRGSTLRLYAAHPKYKPVRALGSFMTVASLLGWTMGRFPLSVMLVATFLVGIGFLFCPLVAWYSADHRIERLRDENSKGTKP